MRVPIMVGSNMLTYDALVRAIKAGSRRHHSFSREYSDVNPSPTATANPQERPEAASDTAREDSARPRAPEGPSLQAPKGEAT